MYDVMIVGAGPSGSTAAKILSEKGFKVLIAERLGIPRYKSCSGILIKKTIDLVKLYLGEPAPIYTMCAPTQNRGMIFTDDKGGEFTFEQEGLNVRREPFDHWLLTKAADCGAEIRDSTSALSCNETNGVVTVTLQGKNRYSEQAKYVIDCEGVTGVLKRKMVKSKPQYITTFQTFNEGRIDLDPHYFYAYLQPDLSEYDAWFNVKDHLLALGVSVKDQTKIQLFYNRFITYMIEKHNLQIIRQVKAEKWLMPRVYPACPIDYGIGQVLFAGEIAGFLNPMGEGISSAIESGYCAASAIADNFENPKNIYACYQDSTKELKAYMRRQWGFVAKMADTFKEMK